jgi:signal transduction histidine kinase
MPIRAPDLLRSLVLRIGLAFLLGLIMVQLVVAVAVLWPDQQPTLLRLAPPAQMAAIVQALEATSGPQREAVIRALDHAPLHVQVQRDVPAPQSRPAGKSTAGAEAGAAAQIGTHAAPQLPRLRARYAAALDGRPFEVLRRPESGDGGGLRMVVRLRTGDVLIVERTPVLLRRLEGRHAIVAAAVAVILVLLLLYCVRQVVLPARRLAAAARGLADDIDMPDIPEHGAGEIRMLAAAFNEMKRTIRALVDERTRLLAAIAHDLRTYLTRLRLRVDFIADARQQERAVRDLEDMSLLLDDTLTFARETERPARRDATVIDARGELEAFVRTRREMGDAVDLASPLTEPLPVCCTVLALRRMLSNLVDNAVRYGKNAHILAWREGDQVRFAVDDDGPGLPVDAMARMLRPFERLEPSRGRRTGGTGLGLAIVMSLAQSQGGALHIENRREGGLRALLILPAPPETAS